MSKLSLMKDLSLLSQLVYKLARNFPEDEKFNTTQQMKRAMVSVRLNVREGNVFFDKRKLTHFQRALGSLVEVDECMEIACDLGWFKDIDSLWGEKEIIPWYEAHKEYKDQYWLCLNKLKKLIASVNSERSEK